MRRTQAIFRHASRIVLGNFTLRSDATVVRHPDRYSDKRGERMWATVTEMLAQGETRRAS